MARLYQYANSNEKSGYFLIGDNGNATFQVTTKAQSLLKKLDYSSPPVKTEQQGPQVPSKLHWLLFDIGWVHTGEEDAGKNKHEQATAQLEAAETLTDKQIDKIRQFVKEHRGDEAQELANKLDINTVSKTQDRLATLNKQKYEPLEEYVWGLMSTVLRRVEEESIEAMDVTVLDLSDYEHTNNSPRSSLNVTVLAPGTEPNYRHSIISSVEDGIAVVSATDAPQTWEEQGRMNRHQGHLLGALGAISEDSKMDFEFDESEIDTRQPGDHISAIEYYISFERDIVISDDMRWT